jgi:hypothetical protein
MCISPPVRGLSCILLSVHVTIYCSLWPPGNTTCLFLTWYQSARFRSSPLVAAAAARPGSPPPRPAAAADSSSCDRYHLQPPPARPGIRWFPFWPCSRLRLVRPPAPVCSAAALVPDPWGSCCRSDRPRLVPAGPPELGPPGPLPPGLPLGSDRFPGLLLAASCSRC